MVEPHGTADGPIARTILLSYDVAGASRSLSIRVAHMIFGRSDAGPDAATPYVARAGVAWIGQSVFLMPESLALELAMKLRGLGATVATAPVAISRSDLEAFRRRRRPRSRTVSMLPERPHPRDPGSRPPRIVSPTPWKRYNIA